MFSSNTVRCHISAKAGQLSNYELKLKCSIPTCNLGIEISRLSISDIHNIVREIRSISLENM